VRLGAFGLSQLSLALPLGTYTIEASATNYATETAQVVLDTKDEVVTRDFALRRRGHG
jgi:hypothetical protein